MFTILIGMSTNWRGKKEFNGNFNYTNIDVKSIEICRKIAELAEIKSYRIVQTQNNIVTVFETSDITEYFDRKWKKREEFVKIQNKRVEEINSWPKRMEIPGLDIPKLKVILERSKYEFEQERSLSLQGQVDCILIINGYETKNFWVENYKGRDGRLLSRKFLRDYKYTFEENEVILNIERARTILATLIAAKKEFEKKINKAY